MTSSTPTGFFLHPDSSRHDTGWRHPEHQGRLRAISRAVEKAMVELHGAVEQHGAREATEDELLTVHTDDHVERIRSVAERARSTGEAVRLDPDTVVSPASWEAAVGGAGALLSAVEAVVAGTVRNAFAATRPPGHHATPDRAMGFCLFNNVAVAARAAVDSGDAGRVLIVDWDVHHGNGTQDVFWEDPSVFYLSLHQHPHYPGTGLAEERGAGAGEGTTLNVPLPPGTPAERYRETFTSALDDATADFSPELILVSSGFDVLAGDPLGGQELEPADLRAMTREVAALAEERCGGRLAVCLEGGYDTDLLGRGTVDVLRGLAGLEEGAG